MQNTANTTLNPLTEMMVLTTEGNTKNLIITGIETFGPFDENAFAQGFIEGLHNNPKLCSNIREIRVGSKNFFTRELREPEPVIHIKHYDRDLIGPGLSAYLESFASELDKKRNLFEEMPVELHLFRLEADHHIIAPVVHHAVADGGVASEFGREILSNYERIRTGKSPEWARNDYAMSSTRKRLVRLRENSNNSYFKDALAAIRQSLHRPTLPKGSGTPGDTRQFHVKRTFSKEQTSMLVSDSIRKGAALIDSLVACSNTVIDAWNRKRNIANGDISTSVSVNMRGRYEGFERRNNSGLIFFKSSPDQRVDTARFLKQLSLQRIKQFRNQQDFRFYKDVSRVNDLLRRAPFHVRRFVWKNLMKLQTHSIAITMLGVIWPKIKNGKPTTESSFTRVGEMEIAQVHGMGYKLLSNTPILLIVYIYNEMINFMLAASAAHFTREETEDFLDLIVCELLENLK